MSTLDKQNVKESTIEDYLETRCRELGIFLLKNTGMRGIPDRQLILEGRHWFLEVKRPGKKPTELQEKVAGKLRRHGAVTLCADTKPRIDEVLSAMSGGWPAPGTCTTAGQTAPGTLTSPADAIRHHQIGGYAMTFDEACGIKNPHGISHNHKYKKYLDRIGAEAVQHYLPEPLDVLVRAYREDRDLNNIPLSKWEKAAGYPGNPPRQGRQPPVATGPFPRLLMSHGITLFSVSECVSLLKYAAEQAILDRVCATQDLSELELWAVFEHCSADPDPVNKSNIFDFDCVDLFYTENEAIRCEDENPGHRVRKLVHGRRHENKKNKKEVKA